MIDNKILPNNWIYTTVSTICEIKSGNTPKDINNYGNSGNIPFYKISDMNVIGNERYMFSSQILLNEDDIKKLKLYLCSPGTIIFPKRGGAIATNKKRILAQKSTYDLNILGIFPIGISYLYIYYWLQTVDLSTLSDGSNIPQINHKDIVGLCIPLPPLAEQNRIVAKIEELFTKLDAGVESLKKAKVQFRQYRQAVLKSAFEGRLTEEWRISNPNVQHINTQMSKIDRHNIIRRDVPDSVDKPEFIKNIHLPDKWEIISIANLIRNGAIIDLKDGNHGTNHPKIDDFSYKGLPFITAEYVNDFNIDYNNAPKIDGEPLKKMKVGFSHPGDVILTHKGTIGRVAINKEECVLSPQTTYYRVNNSAIINRYLAYALLSPIFQLQLSKVKSQTTRDFVSISKQYSLFLPIAPIEEQRIIIESIENYFSIINQVDKTIDEQLTFTDALRQSILVRAFSGKLVPQDPNDEPAGKLLERIRAHRAKNEASKPASPGKRRSRQTALS